LHVQESGRLEKGCFTSRSEAKKITQTAEANSKQDQANAQGSFANTNQAIGDFGKGVADYRAGLAALYGPGGSARASAANVSDASNASLRNDLDLTRLRTGLNDANFAGTEAEAVRKADRDLTAYNAQMDEKLNQGQQFALGEQSRIPGMYSSLYGTSLQGADQSLNTAVGANQQDRGFFDTLGSQLGQLAASGVSAYKA
jgi:hypothetical protein